MQLILSVEGQNCTQIGLADVLAEARNTLCFLLDENSPYSQKYGDEFDSITIIPTCVSDRTWSALGWKERILIRRKNREADIRLRMDYDLFVDSDQDGKRAMFIDVLVKSIKAIQERSNGNFDGEALIEDVIKAF